MSYRVRTATDADVPTLLELEQGVIAAERPFDPTLRDPPIRYYDLERLIASPDIELAVVDHGDEVIGSGYARLEAAEPFLRHRQHAYVGFMFVRPAHRGRGVSGLVIDHLAKWARGRGVNELRLDVYHDNHGAIRAYEKAGFVRHMILMRRG
jgi:GNAT superfamily N-acetyltransferase